MGTQVAPPIFIHRALPVMGKKRDLPCQTPNFHHRYPNSNPVSLDSWNRKVWEWDSVRFVAEQTKREEQPQPPPLTLRKTADEEDESLRLNLGGSLTCVDETPARPNKRVRSGSPGSTAYPMCQVDNCKEDLSSAKDYHRRHKVCELHSKSTKALVSNQMQRFCQQCSRYPLVFFHSFMYVN